MLDHLVYATPDLHATVLSVAAAIGISPSAGGRHDGLGTRNFLLSLGAGSYLEIIGPDRDQGDPAGPRPFGIDTLQRPTLVRWAMRTTDIGATVSTARSAGFDPGEPVAMQRTTPDGKVLHWRLTLDDDELGNGIVPFLIDWGTTTHPATTSATGAALLSFTAHHPRRRDVEARLNALDTTITWRDSGPIGLQATIVGPRGSLVL